MGKLRYLLIIFFIGVLFFSFRLVHLPETVNFGADQGLQMLEIWDRYQKKQFTLIGPYSSFQVEGRQLFFGPSPYYLSMPILILGKWNPLSMSYFMVIFTFLSALTVYIIDGWVNQNRKRAILFLLLIASIPPTIEYSRFYWNPNFLMPITLMILSCIIYFRKNSSQAVVFLIGLLLGFGMQFHYSFILTIISIFVWLFWERRRIRVNWLILLFGAIIGFSPLIIFDARHDLYNLRIVWSFLRNERSSFPLVLHFYYFISILPLILYLLAEILSRLVGSSRLKFILVIFLLIISGMIFTYSSPSHGFGMVSNWNYPKELRISQIIHQEKKGAYNLVDIHTGDTRAMAIRYLLTVVNDAPQSVTDYPSSDTLFVYSALTAKEITSGDLWEINAVKPLSLTKQWMIDESVSLFRFDRFRL